MAQILTETPGVTKALPHPGMERSKSRGSHKEEKKEVLCQICEQPVGDGAYFQVRGSETARLGLSGWCSPVCVLAVTKAEFRLGQLRGPAFGASMPAISHRACEAH